MNIITNPIWFWFNVLGRVAVILSPKKVAILGSREAGKSTLWKKLRNPADKECPPTTPMPSEMSEFFIEYKGKMIKISKTLDIGGADEHVGKRYEKLIQKGTYIFYLIDLNRLEELKDETRGRIRKIQEVIRGKKLKNTVIHYVGTHYAEFEKQTRKSRDAAKADLLDFLRYLKDKDLDERILVAELTDERDIDQFYDIITKKS